MAERAKNTRRNRWAYALLAILFISIVALGGLALYATGIFTPVERGEVVLEGADFEYATKPPLLSGLLFSEACAEEENYESLDDILLALQQEEEQEVPANKIVNVTSDDLVLNENLSDDWFNILLLGTDSRNIMSNTGRTDVMIVASIRTGTGEVKLTSLARDLFVPIPKVGTDRMNSAYAYGGPFLTLQTINQLFDLNIQYYAVVNFKAMANIVDTLGGVDIELEGEEYRYINYNVAVSEDYEGFEKSDVRRQLTAEDVGLTHLDGLQAVGYARIRMMDNDLHRGSRQRRLLETMMNKVLENADIATLTRLAMSVMADVQTNLPLTNIITMAGEFLQSPGLSLSEMSIPIKGSYRNSVINEMAVMEMTVETNVQGLHEFIYGEYVPSAKEEP